MASIAAFRRRRDPPLATYAPDYLTNYEIGYKTSWLDNRLRFNGAFFYEDWQNIQFGFLGQNSFTIVRNAGTAHIKGAEQQLEWVPIQGLNLHLAATELDPKMSQNFCYERRHEWRAAAARAMSLLQRGARWHPAADRAEVQGRCDGTLHVPAGSADLQGYGQAAYSYTSSTNSELSPYQNSLIGNVPAYGLLDLALGVNKGSFQAELFASNALDKRAQTYRFAECTIVSSGSIQANNSICGSKPMATIVTPRTIGIRFSQTF